MKRILGLGIIVFIVGCGEGPKHLSKSDYQNGKAAFEMLEQFESTSSDSFHNSALRQMEQIKNLDLLGTLVNYSISINERIASRIVAPDRFDELSPIVKLCHDDAAQYFDKDAASTNTCNAELTAFQAKYNTKKEKLR